MYHFHETQGLCTKRSSRSIMNTVDDRLSLINDTEHRLRPDLEILEFDIEYSTAINEWLRFTRNALFHRLNNKQRHAIHVSLSGAGRNEETVSRRPAKNHFFTAI